MRATLLFLIVSGVPRLKGWFINLSRYVFEFGSPIFIGVSVWT